MESGVPPPVMLVDHTAASCTYWPSHGHGQGVVVSADQQLVDDQAGVPPCNGEAT